MLAVACVRRRAPATASCGSARDELRVHASRSSRSPPHAREDIALHGRGPRQEERGSRSRRARDRSSRATPSGADTSTTASTQGRRSSARTTRKLNFVDRRARGRSAIQFRRDSHRTRSRTIDWMQDVLPNGRQATVIALMRHFYRTHLAPADVLDARRRVLSRRSALERSGTTRRASRTFSGPLGALKLQRAGRRAGTTRSSRSRPIRWARAASTGT